MQPESNIAARGGTMSVRNTLQTCGEQNRFSCSVISANDLHHYHRAGRFREPDFLSPFEIRLLQRHRNERRRREWLGGRYAAQNAIVKYLYGGWKHFPARTDLEIRYTEKGAPYFVQFPDLCVSISHSYPVIAAVIADYPIGLDIEKSCALPQCVIDYFFSTQEKEALQDFSYPKPMSSIFWTRKEAVSKCLRLGMHLPFNNITVSDPDAVVIKGMEDVRLHIESYLCNDDYALSVAFRDTVAATASPFHPSYKPFVT